MRFHDYRQAYREPLRDAIRKVIDDADMADSTLASMLAYQMETGGKRLRAVLPLMVADALQTPPDKLVAFGAACELIHNATLIHDDLQDGDRLRRGQPAVWSKFGDEQAINLGDAILMLAPLCLESVDVDDQLRWDVASRMCRRVLQVIDGQQREFELDFDSATFDDYRRMVTGKTSGLFALPIVEAARLCGAGPELCRGLDAVARPLGVLFQIQDDILDLYGDKGRDARGGDIREGKISALVVAYLSRADDHDITRLRHILSAPRDDTTDDDVQWATLQFHRSGALEITIDRLETLRARALSADLLNHHRRLRALIEELCDVLLEPIDDLR